MMMPSCLQLGRRFGDVPQRLLENLDSSSRPWGIFIVLDFALTGTGAAGNGLTRNFAVNSRILSDESFSALVLTVPISDSVDCSSAYSDGDMDGFYFR
jgi:hypothetical protein